MKLTNIKTARELIQYWLECANSSNNIQNKAYQIVGAVVLDVYDDLEAIDPEIGRVFALASELELPEGDEPWRQGQWQKLLKHLARLQKRYPTPINDIK